MRQHYKLKAHKMEEASLLVLAKNIIFITKKCIFDYDENTNEIPCKNIFFIH